MDKAGITRAYKAHSVYQEVTDYVSSSFSRIIGHSLFARHPFLIIVTNKVANFSKCQHLYLDGEFDAFRSSWLKSLIARAAEYLLLVSY